MKFLIIFLFAVIVMGCVSQTKIDLPVHIALDTEATPIIIEKMKEGNKILLKLGVIPGDLYGTPLVNPYWYIDLNESLGPSIEIMSFEKGLQKHARPYNEVEHNFKLDVEPKNTGLVRVSTFGLNATTQSYLSGGLKDKYGNYILLVYFDRPCKISGLIDFNTQGVFTHHIEIPEAGLYQLKIIDNKGYTTVKASRAFDRLNVVLQ